MICCTLYDLVLTVVELTSSGEVEEWGNCLPDCPTQDTNPVCLMDPAFPALEDGFQKSRNYTTDFVIGSGQITRGVRRNV